MTDSSNEDFNLQDYDNKQDFEIEMDSDIREENYDLDQSNSE